MRACLIDGKIFFEGRMYDLEPSSGFGGFCECGGLMNQIGWVGMWLMVSECESCWKVEVFLYKDFIFVERFEIPCLSMREFLMEILTPSEFDALIKRLNGKRYNYSMFSRAKKKIEEINLSFDKIIEILKY